MTDLFGEVPRATPTKRNTVAEPTIRPDGQYACAICQSPAYFGFGVKLLAGRAGRWACLAHRDAVKSSSGK